MLSCYIWQKQKKAPTNPSNNKNLKQVEMTNFIKQNKDSKPVPSMIAVVNLGMQQICYNHDGNENISRIWTVYYFTLFQKLRGRKITQ